MTEKKRGGLEKVLSQPKKIVNWAIPLVSPIDFEEQAGKFIERYGPTYTHDQVMDTLEEVYESSVKFWYRYAKAADTIDGTLVLPWLLLKLLSMKIGVGFLAHLAEEAIEISAKAPLMRYIHKNDVSIWPLIKKEAISICVPIGGDVFEMTHDYMHGVLDVLHQKTYERLQSYNESK